MTTRELARMIRRAVIRFDQLPGGEFDQPPGLSTGAGAIFAAIGRSWRRPSARSTPWSRKCRLALELREFRHLGESSMPYFNSQIIIKV
ncbi:[Fe-Fe] hydrogenase large subunit C-terminal domain-containing protein [Desulfofundulus sp. TPOSR]|uniref:[Fe-Fe] hydrogenase large subunit C-terminal domain-containing protein n=1 Tax=Desulfofundulus sp. TPOSR TaxID=2714340 RepID=UPI001FABD42C|nr:[Fe-Fe] hydrogenase large subunit C-terminal domain-containing protein [Desulfofundulus sp. TPOSR]